MYNTTNCQTYYWGGNGRGIGSKPVPPPTFSPRPYAPSAVRLRLSSLSPETRDETRPTVMGTPQNPFSLTNTAVASATGPRPSSQFPSSQEPSSSSSTERRLSPRSRQTTYLHHGTAIDRPTHALPPASRRSEQGPQGERNARRPERATEKRPPSSRCVCVWGGGVYSAPASGSIRSQMYVRRYRQLSQNC